MDFYEITIKDIEKVAKSLKVYFTIQGATYFFNKLKIKNLEKKINKVATKRLKEKYAFKELRKILLEDEEFLYLKTIDLYKAKEKIKECLVKAKDKVLLSYMDDLEKQATNYIDRANKEDDIEIFLLYYAKNIMKSEFEKVELLVSWVEFKVR